MMNRRGFLLRMSLLPTFAWIPWQQGYGSTAAHPTIIMRGTPRGERVWFDPQGLWIAPGQTVRFVNEDKANVHSATAFHPELYGRERRIPARAPAWSSELLLPGEHYEILLQMPGVYDYYCLPHAAHGMVGRIVVGTPEDKEWTQEDYHQSSHAQSMPGVFPDLKDLLTSQRLPKGS